MRTLTAFFLRNSPESVAPAAEVKAPAAAPASGDAPADPEDALIESKYVEPICIFLSKQLADCVLPFLQLGPGRRVRTGDTICWCEDED